MCRFAPAYLYVHHVCSGPCLSICAAFVLRYPLVCMCITCMQVPAYVYVNHMCVGNHLSVCAPCIKVSNQAIKVHQIPMSLIRSAGS